MIRYALKCSQGHAFESWFQSAGAFDDLMEKGLVTCPECGAGKVAKAVMAPRVSARAHGEAPDGSAMSVPDDTVARALAEMRARIEAESDYVGPRFAEEARAMHLGDAPERAIHGEAKPKEAMALIEEGVPVLPLPFLPRRKVN
ncbi:MAG TPA: DUF1178 family protein [Aliiroseovarius sp.]|nr:DUF1178 family protein [Aliiroseovarius sp.]